MMDEHMLIMIEMKSEKEGRYVSADLVKAMRV